MYQGYFSLCIAFGVIILFLLVLSFSLIELYAKMKTEQPVCGCCSHSVFCCLIILSCAKLLGSADIIQINKYPQKYQPRNEQKTEKNIAPRWREALERWRARFAHREHLREGERAADGGFGVEEQERDDVKKEMKMLRLFFTCEE